MTYTGTMRKPFGGGAVTVLQASAISSAAAGAAAPSSPVLFSQALSRIRDQIRNARTSVGAELAALTAFDFASQRLYVSPLLDDLAVCSQFPEPCGPTDGQFIDGAFSDNPSVALNVAQYQNSEGADMTKTMKLVLTNNNRNFTADTYDTHQILQYFETEFNQNIEPGDYIWLKHMASPYRSPQVFGDSLSEDDLMAAVEPTEGSNITTAIFKATTGENKAFGIQAGQTVELLLINTNEDIITTIASLDLIKEYTVPLAEMAQKIAANEELVSRVQQFFFGDDEIDVAITKREPEGNPDNSFLRG